MLTGLFKDATFGPLSKLHTRILLVEVCRFGNACVKDSRPFISFFHARVFARLAIRHTRVFDVEIPNYAYGAL